MTDPAVWPWAETNQGLLSFVGGGISLIALLLAVGIARTESKRAADDRVRADAEVERANREAERASAEAARAAHNEIWAEHRRLSTFVWAASRVIDADLAVTAQLIAALEGREGNLLQAPPAWIDRARETTETLKAMAATQPPNGPVAASLQRAIARQSHVANLVGHQDRPDRIVELMRGMRQDLKLHRDAMWEEVTEDADRVRRIEDPTE